jgi:hypothetical protein
MNHNPAELPGATFNCSNSWNNGVPLSRYGRNCRNRFGIPRWNSSGGTD